MRAGLLRRTHQLLDCLRHIDGEEGCRGCHDAPGSWAEARARLREQLGRTSEANHGRRQRA
eukprot:6546118-Prymnesium_polylepis.1